MPAPFDVVLCGHLCLDLIPRMHNVPPEALMNPGRLYEVDALDMATGGAVSNTGLALHRLGVGVRLMSTIGDDAIGRLITDYLRGHGEHLVESISVIGGIPSSYTVVLSPAHQDRLFLHCTGTNSVYQAKDVDLSVVSQAKIFHLGYPTLLPRLVDNDGDELLTIMKSVSQLGVITSMDMTLPDPRGAASQVDWRKVLTRVLPYTNIFIPSIEEIMFMLRRADFDQWGHDWHSHVDVTYLEILADELIAMGVSVAGFKLSHFGIFIRTANHLSWSNRTLIDLDEKIWKGVTIYQPAFAVDVLGTTGAGDSAIAGFIASFLYGYDPLKSTQIAAAAGAYRIASTNAHGGIPSFDAIRQRLESGWQVRVDRILGA